MFLLTVVAELDKARLYVSTRPACRFVEVDNYERVWIFSVQNILKLRSCIAQSV